MKNKLSQMKWIYILSTMISINAFGAESKLTPLQCRTKAKAIAKESYNQCLIDNRPDEAESIRQEYKAKVAKLKDYYEKKLKKVSSKFKSENKTAGTSANNVTSPSSNKSALVATPTTATTSSTSTNNNSSSLGNNPRANELESTTASLQEPQESNSNSISNPENKENYAPPAPVNLQENQPIRENSEQLPLKNSSVDPYSEPTIRVKPKVSTTSEGAQPLESEPDLAI